MILIKKRWIHRLAARAVVGASWQGCQTVCAGRQWLTGAWLPSRLAVVRVKGSCVGRTVVGPSAPLPWAKPRSWYVLRAARCVWTGEGRRPCRAHRGGTKDLPQHRLRWLSSCKTVWWLSTAALVRSYGYQTEEPFDICQYRPLVRVLYYCQFVWIVQL